MLYNVTNIMLLSKVQTLKPFFKTFRNECSDKGGTGFGECANGYGICCVCMY
jgi:hypothetical protein